MATTGKIDGEVKGVATRRQYDKLIKLQVAYEIIGNIDDGLKTEWIDKAIEMLKELKHVRENIPF